MEKLLNEIHIAYLVGYKEGTTMSWEEIREKFNEKFKADFDTQALINQWQRYKNMFHSKDYEIKRLMETHRLKKNNSHTARSYNKVLDAFNQREDVIESIKAAAHEAARDLKKRPKIKPVKLKSKKQPMTKELLLSDLHFGKLSSTFNLEVAKKRLEEVVNVTLSEIKRDSVHYNVERLIVAMLGDQIENATMHGLESRKGSEFGNPRQVFAAAKYLFEIVIRPLAETGIRIDVPAVTGNHDRDGHERTYHNPGEENWTYVIYHYLKEMTNLAGYKNVTFYIPKEPYLVMEVYGKNILYEHYDNSKSPNRVGLQALLTRRSSQLSLPIHYMRGGHYHEPTSYGYYKMVINGSLPGNDSFADVNGFYSEASQTLLSYVKTSSRPNPFYKSLVIQLEHIGK